MIAFPHMVIPVTTPIGDGYILYITANGMYENDEITIVMTSNGQIRHFSSDQVKVWNNSTYGIHSND
jgi:hypothetical protein